MSKLQRLVLNHKNGTSEFIIKDENAPAFDEVQNKAEEEKARARENIGAAAEGETGSSMLVVTVDEENWTASHTSQQIYDHVQAGGTAVLNTSDRIGIPLTEAGADYVMFGNQSAEEGFFNTWQIYDDGTAEAYEYHFGEHISDKITTPAKAKVGQTIVVQSVDSNGRPYAWRAYDMPKIITATGIYLGDEGCAIVQKDGECFYSGQMAVALEDGYIIFVHFVGYNPDDGGQFSTYTMIAQSYDSRVSLLLGGTGWAYETNGDTFTYQGKEYEKWGYA